ncbi:MAG TPA: type II 3-dehydroquinate dehydratase [Aeromonadales bacterium]|nr:type II 3-dehydroquinate dehydratase [Aeromonadales bacterium]
MSDILLLNGPNLNMLGKREPEIYGSDSLQQILEKAKEQIIAAGYSLDSLQSNAEEKLVERIQHTLDDDTKIIIINPAAFTHTSVAIRDALLAVNTPFIEIHLSNPMSREPFRHHSFFSDIALGVISGFGAQSYSLAIDAALEYLAGLKL